MKIHPSPSVFAYTHEPSKQLETHAIHKRIMFIKLKKRHITLQLTIKITYISKQYRLYMVIIIAAITRIIVALFNYYYLLLLLYYLQMYCFVLVCCFHCLADVQLLAAVLAAAAGLLEGFRSLSLQWLFLTKINKYYEDTHETSAKICCYKATVYVLVS